MASASRSPISTEDVRTLMRRTLTDAERLEYRGITMTGRSGTKYDQLFGIETTEALIAAEYYGRKASPSDEPGSVYLFSKGHGLTAKCNAEWAKLYIEDSGPPPPGWKGSKPLQELHEEYLSYPRPDSVEDQALVDQLMHDVATEYVSWVSARMAMAPCARCAGQNSD